MIQRNKKILSLLLVFAMILSMVPMAMATDGHVAEEYTSDDTSVYAPTEVTPDEDADDAYAIDPENEYEEEYEDELDLDYAIAAPIAPTAAGAVALSGQHTVANSAALEALIAGGTVQDGDTIMLTAAISIPAGEVLDLNFGGANVTFLVDGNRRHFDINGANSELILNEGVTLTRATGYTDAGGGIRVRNTGTLTMNGGTITNVESSGGAVIVDNGGTFTMNNGAIDNNIANTAGGVMLQGSGAVFTMVNGSISGNEAATAGGGIRIADGAEFTMTGGTISNNIANNGGGVDNRGTFTMNGGLISGNDARVTAGGGVEVRGGLFLMTNGVIENNTAATNGGGVAAVTGGTIQLSGTAVIRDNEAVHGGGVSLSNSSVEMSGGVIEDNRATFTGGGILLVNSPATITSGVIRYNRALAPYTYHYQGWTGGSGGGITAGVTSILNISQPNDSNPVLIYGNEANVGGGIWISQGEAHITGGTIRYNSAHALGGGVGFNVLPNLTISNPTRIYNNTAFLGNNIFYRENSGDGIVNIDDDVSTDGLAVVRDGGSIFVDPDGGLNFTISEDTDNNGVLIIDGDNIISAPGGSHIALPGSGGPGSVDVSLPYPHGDLTVSEGTRIYINEDEHGVFVEVEDDDGNVTIIRPAPYEEPGLDYFIVNPNSAQTIVRGVLRNVWGSYNLSGSHGLLRAQGITGMEIPPILFELVDPDGSLRWRDWFMQHGVWQPAISPAVSPVSFSAGITAASANPTNTLAWNHPDRITDLSHFFSYFGYIVVHGVYLLENVSTSAEEMDALATLNAIEPATAAVIILFAANANWTQITNAPGVGPIVPLLQYVLSPLIVDAQTPNITSNLQSQTVNVGTPVNLGVTAVVTDGGVLSYQWQREDSGNWVNITSATSASYSPNTAAIGTSRYRVVITNTFAEATGAITATATSDVATVVVNASDLTNAQSPNIVSHPQSATVNVGVSVSLNVMANIAEGVLSYQWQREVDGNWENIAGATGSTFAPNTAAVGISRYRVVVTNTLAGATGAQTAVTTSDVAIVTVNAAGTTNAASPVIFTQPQNQLLNVNGTTNLSIVAAQTDSGVISYQWQRAAGAIGGNWEDIGTNSNTFAPSTATVGVNRYRVVVTNTLADATGVQAATVISNVVTVAVLPSNIAVPPSNSVITFPGGGIVISPQGGGEVMIPPNYPAEQIVVILPGRANPILLPSGNEVTFPPGGGIVIVEPGVAYFQSNSNSARTIVRGVLINIWGETNLTGGQGLLRANGITGMEIPQTLFDLVDTPGWEAWFMASRVWESAVASPIVSVSPAVQSDMILPVPADNTLPWNHPDRITDLAHFFSYFGYIVVRGVYLLETADNLIEEMVALGVLNGLEAATAGVILMFSVGATWDQVVTTPAVSTIVPILQYVLTPAATDFSALQTAQTAALLRVATNYTPATWAPFLTARNEAADVLATQGTSAEALQGQVNDALTALNTATGLLVTRANFAALTAAITAAQGRTEATYTPASWTAANLAAAIPAAVTVRDNLNSTQAQVDGALTALNAATGLLVARANFAALTAAITAAQARTEASYTTASWSAANLAVAIPAAVTVRDNLNATQAQVDDALTALNTATGQLVALADTLPPNIDVPSDWIVTQPGGPGGDIIITPPGGAPPSITIPNDPDDNIVIETPGGGTVEVPPDSDVTVTEPDGDIVIDLPGGGGTITIPNDPDEDIVIEHTGRWNSSCTTRQ